MPSGATTGVDGPASVTAHEAEVVVGLDDRDPGDAETGTPVGLGLAAAVVVAATVVVAAATSMPVREGGRFGPLDAAALGALAIAPYSF